MSSLSCDFKNQQPIWKRFEERILLFEKLFYTTIMNQKIAAGTLDFFNLDLLSEHQAKAGATSLFWRASITFFASWNTSISTRSWHAKINLDASTQDITNDTIYKHNQLSHTAVPLIRFLTHANRKYQNSFTDETNKRSILPMLENRSNPKTSDWC